MTGIYTSTMFNSGKPEGHNRTVSIHRSSRRALSLVEVIVAMVIVAVIVAAIIPQIRTVRIGWAMARENTELLENGQALMDHIMFNLIKAKRIMVVSDACDVDGYIEFMDSNGDIMRYQIGDSNYVQYGHVGDLDDLAGPVSVLQFACYSPYDLNTPTLEVDFIRSVEIQATLPNPNELGRDHTLTGWAYLRTNYLAEQIIVSTEYLFDSYYCRSPVLAKIDDEHFLCAYEKPSNIWSDGRGYAVVLIPRYISDEWQISKRSYFQFDSSRGQVPELCRIDATHYLCAYRGPGSDGWSVVLKVSTGSWTISKGSSFEFANNTGLPPIDGGGPDVDPAFRPALVKINSTHYLCAYTGAGYDGWAVVLTINPSTYAISAGTPFEFDTIEGQGPALAQIDNTHYLCVYSGAGAVGKSVVLEVNTESWAITKKTPFVFDSVKGERPDLAKINDERYLCAYGGPDNDGWVVVLNVDTTSWEITKNTPYEFDTVRGEMPKLQRIDSVSYVCSYEGYAGREEDFDYPASIILYVNWSNWRIYRKTPVIMYGEEEGDTPDIAVIDDRTFFSVYDGYPWKGSAVVLEVDLQVKP